MVNALCNKGVETTVGFQTKIWFSYVGNEESANYGKFYIDGGYGCWVQTFTKKLGEGLTVDEAIRYAYSASIAIPGEGVDSDGNTVPADWGLGSVYVAGNSNQVVKH